jgi:hypothetical protein
MGEYSSNFRLLISGQSLTVLVIGNFVLEVLENWFVLCHVRCHDGVNDNLSCIFPFVDIELTEYVFFWIGKDLHKKEDVMLFENTRVVEFQCN